MEVVFYLKVGIYEQTSLMEFFLLNGIYILEQNNGVCFETGFYYEAVGGLELCIDHADLKLRDLPASTF